MLLTRTDISVRGAFGVLTYGDNILFHTLEHAYPTQSGWAPKVPAGPYTCVRGIHQLASGAAFETFEVTEVPGHSGILFHSGNTEVDSSGCILLGEDRIGSGLVGSRAAFSAFMALMRDIDSFTLLVV